MNNNEKTHKENTCIFFPFSMYFFSLFFFRIVKAVITTIKKTFFFKKKPHVNFLCVNA